MQKLRIDHVTEYRFPAAVALLEHRLLLRPRENHEVRIASSRLEITPPPMLRWRRDTLDNAVALATFQDSCARLRIASSVVIEQYQQAPLDFVVEDHALMYPFQYAEADAFLLSTFRRTAWPGSSTDIESWVRGLGLKDAAIETYALLERMMRAVHESFLYEVRLEPGVQTQSETLSRRAGSCRDFAAFFLEACRTHGLASRFVSGYMHVPSQSAPGATHAWAEVYLPGPGWKGFDPTHGCLAGADHIAVAVAHHPAHVPPVAGRFVGPLGWPPVLDVSLWVSTCG